MDKENNKKSAIDKFEKAIVRFAENTETNIIYAKVVYFLTYLFIVPLILACYTIFSVIMPVSLKQFSVLVVSLVLLYLFVVLHNKFYPNYSLENVLLFFLLFNLSMVAFLPPIKAVLSTLF